MATAAVQRLYSPRPAEQLGSCSMATAAVQRLYSPRPAEQLDLAAAARGVLWSAELSFPPSQRASSPSLRAQQPHTPSSVLPSAWSREHTTSCSPRHSFAKECGAAGSQAWAVQASPRQFHFEYFPAPGDEAAGGFHVGVAREARKPLARASSQAVLSKDRRKASTGCHRPPHGRAAIPARPVSPRDCLSTRHGHTSVPLPRSASESRKIENTRGNRLLPQEARGASPRACSLGAALRLSTPKDRFPARPLPRAASPSPSRPPSAPCLSPSPRHPPSPSQIPSCQQVVQHHDVRDTRKPFAAGTCLELGSSSVLADACDWQHARSASPARLQRCDAVWATTAYTPTQQHRDLSKAAQNVSSTPRVLRQDAPEPHQVENPESDIQHWKDKLEQQQRLHDERLRQLEKETREERERLNERLRGLEQQRDRRELEHEKFRDKLAQEKQAELELQRADELQMRSPPLPHQLSTTRPSPKAAKAQRGDLMWLMGKLDPVDSQPRLSEDARPGPAVQEEVETDDPEIPLQDIEKKAKIGAGSFGAVWKAELRGQVVAIKVCQMNKESEAKMIQDEITYLFSLRHPRLVSFLGYACEDNEVNIVMEFMPGGSLSQLLFCKKQVIAFHSKAIMAGQIGEGLAFLHDLNVVHRDLKTANVVLDQDLSCKICDFGLTVTLDRSHMTVRSLQGSPRYMAPEQLEAHDRKPSKITEKVDIWQMGCLLLELFCLVVPFEKSSSVASIVAELLVRKRPPVIPENADPRARVLCGACLRLSAKARPSAAVLLEAIQGLC